MSIIATAQVRRSLGTIDAATSEPMPKNAPCGKPDRKRVSISQPYSETKPEAALATANHTISPMRTVLRRIRAASTAMSGAPTTTPSA